MQLEQYMKLSKKEKEELRRVNTINIAQMRSEQLRECEDLKEDCSAWDGSPTPYINNKYTKPLFMIWECLKTLPTMVKHTITKVTKKIDTFFNRFNDDIDLISITLGKYMERMSKKETLIVF